MFYYLKMTLLPIKSENSAPILNQEADINIAFRSFVMELN